MTSVPMKRSSTQNAAPRTGGTTGIADSVSGSKSSKFKSKVVAPRNPKLVRSSNEDDKQTPSAYMAEMALSTEERLKQTYEMRIPQIIELLDMSETTHQKFTSVDIEEPLFQPFPSEIVFQNFEPFETYKIPLQLRNNDKVARLVKVTQADSPYFSIISPADVGHKVAPGMDTIFIIQFTPDEKKDYNHELICITEREKFLVQVKAVGARAILDFPDEINFGMCPVKYSSTKTLLVRNIGNKEANFNLLTESAFSTDPESAVLGIGESIQIDVQFNAMKTGGHTSDMVIQYETGEDIYVSLYGAAVDVNVRLDKNTVKLENTYITSASQRVVTISNRSDIIVHYEWKAMATLIEEQQQKLRFYQELTYKEEEEKDNFLEECISDPTLRDKLSLITRSFKNKAKIAEGDKMLYSDEVITVDPVEGDVWPNSQADINVIFHPDEAKSYARTIYCDITGRESRLPLRIRGDGLGPKIQFSFDVLDIESVFVNSEHSYEVILANKGDIDAVFSYLPSETLFGQEFTFVPTQGIVRPGGYQAIQIHFSSPYLGEFVEDFVWMVEGSPQKFKFNIKGSVIGPTFHFDVPKLKFGIVSYGFTHVKSCKLINTSLIPMSFMLRVPSDGQGPSAASIAGSFLTHYDPAASDVRSYAHPPMEFEILPSSGVLPPQSQIDIQVNMTSLTVKKYETVMVVDVDGVGEEILSLPISAKCIVPAICIESPILDFGRCFIHHLYETLVQLKNESDLPAKYQLISQIPDERMIIHYRSTYPKGIIEARSELEIPLQITVYGIGELNTHCYFMIYGDPEHSLPIQINCIGEGPVLHVSTPEIEFGPIPVLSDVTKQIELSNESLIPAKFSCEMVRPNSLFRVEPSSGIIPSEQRVLLAVTANVDDCLRFQDKIAISVVDSQTHSIHLTAAGTGTTIVSDPPMAPTVNLGPILSSRLCTRTFRFTNKGRRSQQIFWTTEGFPHARTRKKQDYNPDDVKYQRMPPPPEPPKPVFKVVPERMALSPGQSHQVVLEGYSEGPQHVKERMICHAIVGNNTGKEKIMKVDIIAEFIQPLVQFSTRKIDFYVMKHPESDLLKETKELLIGNISLLPLNIQLRVEFPFQILAQISRTDVTPQELSVLDISLHVNQSMPILIQFDPAYQDDTYCRSIETKLEVIYKDHPNTDYVELKGDVYYPNLTFETEVVDFGCVLNDTEHVRNVTVTNHSPLEVKFNWSFHGNNINFEEKEDDEGLGKEISDGEEEEDDDNKIVHQASSQHKIAQTAPEFIPKISFPSDYELRVRPHTSPALHLSPMAIRPRTAPDSTDTFSQRSPLLPWIPADGPITEVGIEEIFDVLPLYGSLQPGETQQFQFTFYGHSHTMAEAVAVCSVYGGPDYRIQLKGQASLLQYGFNSRKIDLGKQIYDQITTSEIVLYNHGKVNFDFIVMDTSRGTRPQPGGITVNPTQGNVSCQTSQVLTIRVVPGVPETFEKKFRVRVGHFEPELITIGGEGIFPRIVLDLPHDVEDPRYCKFLEEAKRSLSARTKDITLEMDENVSLSDVEVQAEIERLQVKDFAVEQQTREMTYTSSLMNTMSTTKTSRKINKPRPVLSDYLLDFGHVVFGTVCSHLCQITNIGFLPVSLSAEKRNLKETGFALELDKVKALPEEEAVNFSVTFDPKAANLSLGPVEAFAPIKITNGPLIGLQLKAYVTMPDLELSTNFVDFESVVCGQCKVITIQLYNRTQVRCDWVAEAEEKRKKSLKKLPMHLRRKMKTEKSNPRTFEMMPPTGSLRPGQRLNIQVKFMPTEEVSYNQRLGIYISQSTQKRFLSCKGQGSEAKLEFSETMLKFGPVLPHASGDEVELLVKNPAPYPVEFYSLEFDKQYLEEEKVLRAMKGYDEYNTILLPPRQPGDTLPQELLDAYAVLQKKKDEEKSQKQQQSDANNLEADPTVLLSTEGTENNIPEDVVEGKDGKDEEEPEKPKDGPEFGVGELEITPVSAAIARHLGIDLSAEGRAARNRRGIAIIVHGAPLSGKTATATDIAKKYQCALISMDEVIIKSIATGISSAALRARELSAAVARAAVANEDTLIAGQQVSSMDAISNSMSVGHANVASGIAPSNLSSLHPNLLGKEGRKTTTTMAEKRQHGTSKAAAHVSPPATPPLGPPPPRKLSIPAVGSEEGFYSCTLPDDILVELLSDRLQMSDCQYGVVFDGLQSLFTASISNAANIVLRTINNRKYIFAVTLKFDKEKLKVIEEKRKEEKAKAEKEELEAERRRIEEMTEDEYEALSDERKAEIDRKILQAKKDRIKKKEIEEERKRKKEREEEEKKLLEEDVKNQKKPRRVTASQAGARKGHEKTEKGGGEKKQEKSSDRLSIARETTQKDRQTSDPHGRAPTAGNLSDRSESTDDIDRTKRIPVSRSGNKFRGGSVIGIQLQTTLSEVSKPPEEDEKEKELNQRFQAFEQTLQEITSLFDAWDRTTGTVTVTTSTSEGEPEPVPTMPGPKSKAQPGHKKGEKEKDKLKDIPGSPVSAFSLDNTESHQHQQHLTDEEEQKRKDGIGVPNIVLQTKIPQESMIQAVFDISNQIRLPSTEEVLEGLGMGLSGPPLPPPACFSVVPYPVRRKSPLNPEFGRHYLFVSSGPDDPNATKEEKTRTPETEIDKPVEKKDHRSKKHGREKDDRDSNSLRSRPDRQHSGSRRGRQSVNQFSTSPPSGGSPFGMEEEKSTLDGLNAASTSELVKHRWVIGAGNTARIRIRFRSEELGQFDQTLNFEIVGTRRRYQLFCRGVCAFPSISREPRVVFPHRKKFRKPEEVVHKKYILSNETFEFGPLLAGKNRDRYREGRYAENMEQLCISNTSPMEAEITFCYQNDTNAATFLIEPVAVLLKPGESQLLNIWAYPKTPGFFEDLIVCCIKENPEPVLLKVSCHGVRPELELDKRAIQFDRVLLHRKETRTIYLRNSTLLPVAWKLNGMDNLGDDFSVTVDNGLIEPKTEFALQMHFRAIRATTLRKIVRLEVSDAENVMGLAHAENIQVQAEAYDVALDMSFPKGADGGLDFGTLRVFDDTKQSCSLKNKGRYEISYNFLLEATENSPPNVADLFTVIPNKGTLIPSDRPTTVQVMFRSKSELTIKEQPILKCEIIEPHLGETGENIASIPVKISVRSVYSKYTIYPIRDVNFGATLINTRKTRTITIENKGEFDFRYSIVKMIHNNSQPKNKAAAAITSKRSRDGSASGRSQIVPPNTIGTVKPKRADSMRGPENVGGPVGGGSTLRLQLGMFTIFPANGVVLPKGAAQITVDMYSEAPTNSEEEIAIDISERNPADNPGGIEYKVVGETCLPSISLLTPANVSSIFEEHRIVKNLNVFRYQTQDLEPGAGVYGEEESKFVFYNVIVGHRAKARFKVSNPNKVPCDVVFSVKPISSRSSARWHDVYEVEPQRAAIQPHSFVYATVTFQPPSMQTYTANFEAAVDGLTGSVSKGRNLTFEIHGDGNLPRVTVLKPVVTNKKGNPLLLFSRLLVGRSQTLPLALKNEGCLACCFNMTLIDPDCAFKVIKETDMDTDPGEESDDSSQPILQCTSSKPVFTALKVAIGETLRFSVEFTPTETKRLSAELRLSVIDNPFEDTVIQLLGEGFKEEVTIDNIHGSPLPVYQETGDEENPSVPSNNLVDFGHCPVGFGHHLSFTLTNHSNTDPIRFTWNPLPQLTFSPCTGHLLPNCAKDITVTFLSKEPCVIQNTNVPCRVTKIQLDQGKDKAGGWDDRMRVVKWIDVKPDSTGVKSDEDDRKHRTTVSSLPQTPRPTKKKVIETEPEPPYTAIPGSALDLDLMFNVIADFARYQGQINKVYFKDTLVFQTRMYSFKMLNAGKVDFEYKWNIEPGWTRAPSVLQPDTANEQASTVGPRGSTKSGKSKHGDQGSTKSPAHGKEKRGSKMAKRESVTEQRPVSQTDDTQIGLASRGSKIASAADGRPASAMALAYEVGSVYSEPTGTDTLPFSIEPECGTLKAGVEATFTVRFSPLDIQEYSGTLFAYIPNLEPGREGPVISLLGRSAMPWCHFGLEESDYITGRRNPELKGPGGAPPGFTLNPNTKVIEFQSVGIKTKTVRKFFILNPTNTAYSFHWTNEDISDPHGPLTTSHFTCLTTHGVIEAGKKHEIVFEFVPETTELIESFWRFFIPEQNVSMPFLLVGTSSEPAISLDRSHVNFKELLLGHTATQVINVVNDEDKPFAFSFDEGSRYAPGHVASLTVEPMSGIVPSKSKTPVSLKYCPEVELEVNFNLVCRIKKKTSLLTLNVKAEGFSVSVKLLCEDSQGNKVNLLPSGVNLINFGEVEVNEKVVRQLYIENLGKFNINFTWELKPPAKPKGNKDAWSKDNLPVSILPDSGIVNCGTRRRCQLSYCPPCKMALKGCELLLKVVNGPVFHLTIAGSGIPPGLNFSFTSFNFGPCFVHRPGLPVQKTNLVIENHDTKEVSFECQYENTSHLEVISEPGVLAPGEKSVAQILFYPRELKRYFERVPFEINGLSTTFLDITGEGTEMKVEVVNTADRKVNLGALRVGKSVHRSVKIINNSLAHISFSTAITPSMPALQQTNILSISPTTEISLKPKATCNIDVYFTPKTRIPQFSEEVMLECAGISQPLFVVTGSCHGMEIKLDSDALPFGSVTLGSSSSRKMIMYNIGDIGAAFFWNIDKFKPDFSISPVKGYISPGMEVSFEIVFTPKEINQDIRYDTLRCAIEGGKPLKLVLTGSCIPQMAMKEVIHFVAHVRNRDTKPLALHNKTNQLWVLRPTIDGEYWTGPDTITVEPQQTKNYEITYRPLIMTLENKRHQGSIFFPLPDGTGLLYNLTGTADPPKPVGNVQREVPCKMAYTEVLQVSNWLRKPQRFRVFTEVLKPEKPDPATTLKGLEYVDIPGLSKKDYKLNFYAHKEGSFSAKVTFRNESTGEYQFYYVQFKATAPGIISVIDLSTPVRQSSSHVITVFNPLTTAVSFNINCNIQDVNLPPQFTVPAQSEGLLTFEYLPMKAGEVLGKLSLQSSELGLYLYDLNLTATPAGSERAVHFITTLGTNQVQACKFINYAKSRAEYSCKTDSPEFLVDKTINAASASSGGSEVGIDVTFEPTRIGDCKGTLVATSNAGGEYVFPLFGHCLSPKPQGPYSIKAGSSTAVPFKNVFSQTTSFSFHVDNPCFSVKAGETIRAKKVHNISVNFDGNQGDSKAVRMGKLIVTSARSAGSGTNLAWTFYLKGITP